MKKKTDFKWVFIVTILAFVISIVMTLFSTVTLENVNLLVAILITFLFILLGIIFDIIGVAVTSGDEVAFHSMSSRKVKGGKIGVKLLKNTEKVSSICCDVIGDICGVLSGAISAMLAIRIATVLRININMNFLIGAVVAAVTVGSKAVGKVIGQEHSTEIVHIVGKILNKFIK